MRSIISLCIFLFVANLPVQAQKQPQGSLVIIGGALSPRNEDIYRNFIQLGGGPRDIQIAIIPTASANPSRTGRSYMKDFIRYGVSKRQIQIFPLALVDDPDTPKIDESKWSHNGWDIKLVESLNKVSAVFFVGGDQMRYWITMKDQDGNDSPLLQSIREVYNRGGVIGGTSAGAAIMSDPMFIGGASIMALGPQKLHSENPKANNSPVPMKPGMGFFEYGLVDQHFIKRGRLGRLIAALLTLDNISLGFGIDEDTALVAHGDTLKVTGSSGVFMVDVSNAQHHSTDRGISASGILLHYLEKGDTYHIKKKTFSINSSRPPIQPGKEYYRETTLDTNIFSKDAAHTLVTQGLVDNSATVATGLAFTLGQTGSGNGTKLVFRKDSETKGYWGKINGKETYSALYVSLQIIPIQISISETRK